MTGHVPVRAGSEAARTAVGDMPARQVIILPGGTPVPRWYLGALCAFVGTEPFYPASDDKDTAAAAKAVCRGCDVRAQCLDDALRRSEPYGIWGGLDERERRALVLTPAPREDPARSTGEEQ
jgi:WhiB family transcriptional regulator, redox-sensing transcriptional regulator